MDVFLRFFSYNFSKNQFLNFKIYYSKKDSNAYSYRWPLPLKKIKGFSISSLW